MWHALRLVALLGHPAHMGLRVTLADLYVLVPAAEEEDLLAQYAVEQSQEWLLAEYARWLDIDIDIDIDPAEPDPEEADVDSQQQAPPTDAQALGIVQHLLGARVLESP